MTTRANATLAVVSTALFMVVLDNLVVTVALPVIRADLGASLEDLEWTVNAYVLSFAVLLLPGAALGDRYGRRRVFLFGLAAFTLASALAALAPSTAALIGARALQGAGGAIIAPLTLTLIAEAFPRERRGAALGIWSAISGAGVALGPLVGGAVVDGISWQWIFWINVPIGLLLLPIATRVLTESYGNRSPLDLVGVALVSFGLFALVLGLVRGQALGWGSLAIVALLAAGAGTVGLFVLWERRARRPMLDITLFESRAFALTNAVSLLMYLGMFGSIFLLTQYLQFVLGYSPWQAGLRIAIWTGTTMLVAPFAGVFSERYGARRFMALGLGLQAVALGWIAGVSAVDMAFSSWVVPFMLAGAGMALVFAPSASAILAAVPPQQAGQASGANNAIREIGGVLGVAVLAAAFTVAGGYADPSDFVDGFAPALWIGAAAVAVGALLALALPSADLS